ncbi:hypothetical protein KACHI17_10300 [Sediminibacterium sp. KACHI17]|uniref:Helix-turn-helix domain-containing protein n=1 Tax=Sediminibacterium sp. KACHI17 TaxID=1751071 RepID=A0AAT9GHM0_9BACT
MKESLLVIPEHFLKSINEKQDQIIDLLKQQKDVISNEYITEAEARELFKRKATWFWQMRKSGILPFSKVGKSIYYSRKDLNQLLSDSKK